LIKLNKITAALLFSGLLAIYSCGDKNKKPVSVGLIVKTVGITSGVSGQPGYLEFTTGHIHITEFAVDADRSKGDNIQFTRAVNKQVIIDPSSPVFTDAFDLVQGDYESMAISFKLNNNGNSNALYLFGNYTDQNMVTFQVQLKVDGGQLLSKTALKNGSPSFNLVYETPEYVDFTIDFSALFSVIGTAEWQSAQHQGGNPVTPVFIDGANNTNLHALLLTQLSKCLTVTFR